MVCNRNTIALFQWKNHQFLSKTVKYRPLLGKSAIYIIFQMGDIVLDAMLPKVPICHLKEIFFFCFLLGDFT